MAKITPYTETKENQASAQGITFDMLSAMIEALDNKDYITNPKNLPARRATLEPTLRMEQPALPLEYMSEDDNDYAVPEHRAIMIPQNNLEGIEAVKNHLGEGIRPQTHIAWNLNDKGEWQVDKFMTNGAGLTNLEKIIFYESGMTAQGDAVVPHEDHSRRAWFKDASQIKVKFNCTIEQSETLALAFKILDTTPKMARQFDTWLSLEGKFESGYRYFENLASEIVKVTDIGEPSIIDIADALNEETNQAQSVDADHPADIEMVQAVTYHKLDDPRDDAPTWESKQPKVFKSVLESIRKAKTLKDVKAIGKSLFNDKRFNKTQTTVIWDEYHRRKAFLSPKLRPLALKALERMTDPKVNLAKVAAWLHADGKKALNAFEQGVVWASWKKVKASKAPKQTAMPIDDMMAFQDYSIEDYVEFYE